MRRQLLVESIRIDGETQSRVRIDEETVGEYAEAMKAASWAPWPALTVYFDGTEYWLADGFHRLLAARRNGRKNVTADVKEGSREDAAWASCAANQTHGLRRTNADKRKAVELALKLHPEMSDQTIANHCGVGRELAFAVRRQVVGFLQPERRTGADGKSYPVPPPRTNKAPAIDHGNESKLPAGHRLGPPPKPEERGKSEHVPIQSPPDRTEDAPAVPAFVVDDMGRRIPEVLLPLWNRRQEVQDMLTALSRIRVVLHKAQDNRDPLFSEVPFSSALVHLDQAYNAVQVAKPYAVCAFCQGHGCKACEQRGLLGKFRWEMVPREHKEAVARLIKKERGE